MKNDELFEDVHKLMDKHNIPSVLIIMPNTEEDLEIISVDLSTEEIRQIGHMLADNVPDSRGPLN